MTTNNAINSLYSGYKNFVVNGAMNVWQRGTSFASLAAAAYTADRWYANIGATTQYTVSQQSLGTSSIQYLLRYQRINGQTNTSLNTLANAFTTADSIALQGQQVTLSFYARAGANFSPTSNNIQVYVATGTGTDQSMASLVAGTWTGYSNNTGTTIALTTTLTQYSYTVTLPTNATQVGILITFTPTGTAGANDYMDISNVQLEIGYVPTAFEYRTFDHELETCKSWYQKSFLYATAPVTNAGATTSEQIYFASIAGATTQTYPTVYFPIVMRTSPTITTYNPGNTNAQIRNETTPADCSATTVSNTSDRGFYLTCTGNGGGAIGNKLGIHWTADASL